MTTTRWLPGLAFSLLLAACGGSTPAGNTATGTTFTYGTPQAATADQAGALGVAVESLDSFRASPGAAAGLGVADATGVAGRLLQGGAIGSFSPSSLGASALSVFDVPACATVAAGRVTFTGCTVTISPSSTNDRASGTVTVNGFVGLAADGQTLDWDLSYGVGLTMAGTAATTVNGTLHSSGQVVATATNATGSAASEVSLSVSIAGQSLSAALDESLSFDVTRSATCASGVTGGTLEAKRVWITRPAGVPVAQLPDAAAQVSWTGCGTATVQLGTR
jgi:hypothetical protein